MKKAKQEEKEADETVKILLKEVSLRKVEEKKKYKEVIEVVEEETISNLSYSKLSGDQKLVIDILERKQQTSAIKVKAWSDDKKTVTAI